MNKISHPELVAALAKPGAVIASELTPEMADLWHAATGIAGEATEICEALLNFSVTGDLDMENIIEELGDMEFYLQQLRANTGVTRDDVFNTTTEFQFSADPLEMGAVVAIAGGQVLDFVKKIVIYQKPIDRDALVDVLVKLEGPLYAMRHLCGLALEQVLEQNIAKLSIRYETLSYSNEAAQTRADKA